MARQSNDDPVFGVEQFRKTKPEPVKMGVDNCYDTVGKEGPGGGGRKVYRSGGQHSLPTLTPARKGKPMQGGF